MDLTQYSVEFITIALAHLVAVASPGPDFAIVLRYSITYGKKTALIASIGIGAAIFLHVSYALAGIGLIISTTQWLYDALIILACLFLFYLGFDAFTAKAQPTKKQNNTTELSDAISAKKAFMMGFLTNGLNPKATLFFLALFTVVVKADTPLIIKGAYGVYMAFATTVWFCILSWVLTRQSVREFFQRNTEFFDKMLGIVMIGLSINILINQFIFS